MTKAQLDQIKNHLYGDDRINNAFYELRCRCGDYELEQGFAIGSQEKLQIGQGQIRQTEGYKHSVTAKFFNYKGSLN